MPVHLKTIGTIRHPNTVHGFAYTSEVPGLTHPPVSSVLNDAGCSDRSYFVATWLDVKLAALL